MPRRHEFSTTANNNQNGSGCSLECVQEVLRRAYKLDKNQIQGITAEYPKDLSPYQVREIFYLADKKIEDEQTRQPDPKILLANGASGAANQTPTRPDEEMEMSELKELIQTLMAKLSFRQQRVLQMLFFENRDLKEIQTRCASARYLKQSAINRLRDLTKVNAVHRFSH